MLKIMLHRKVQCWIFSKTATGDTLCLILKTNLARGQFWQPVTGSVEIHEGYFEAACREAAEETHLEFNSPPVDTGYDFEFQSHFGLTKERVFALFVEHAPAPTLDPNEHDEYQWVSIEDAATKIRYPTNRQGLIKSYRAIFGEDPSLL